MLRDRHVAIHQLKANLAKAQERMKKYADVNRTERTFAIGDWVYLKFQPYRQLSIAGMRNQKLSPRFYGPFEIIQRIGKVAYRLSLPPGSAIHDVIHVSQLKKHVPRGQTTSPTLPLVGDQRPLSEEPQLVLARSLVNREGTAVAQLLVKWTNSAEEDGTWEEYLVIKEQYPQFNLEDQEALMGEGVSQSLRAVANLDSVNGSGNNEEAKEKAQIESRVAEAGVHCLNGVSYRWEIRPLDRGAHQVRFNERMSEENGDLH